MLFFSNLSSKVFREIFFLLFIGLEIFFTLEPWQGKGRRLKVPMTVIFPNLTLFMTVKNQLALKIPFREPIGGLLLDEIDASLWVLIRFDPCFLWLWLGSSWLCRNQRSLYLLFQFTRYFKIMNPMNLCFWRWKLEVIFFLLILQILAQIHDLSY